MLLRVSAKFHQQYSCDIKRGEAPVRPFPQTWNFDLLAHGRGQLLILASEEYSLFSVLIPANRSRDLECFLTPFRERLIELFGYVRLWNHPDLSEVTFSGRSNRRIIGSQNDLIFLSRSFLEGSEKPASTGTVRKVEEALNSTPMSYLQMGAPMDAMWRELERLQKA